MGEGQRGDFCEGDRAKTEMLCRAEARVKTMLAYMLFRLIVYTFIF